jgi:beta-lactamase superfamily II metal-dependent hydrolase
MYNVGFGDCFLVTLPTTDGPRRILIDCGTHPSSTGPRRASDAVPLLLDAVRDAGGTPRVDVVVVSHRHADHVSGFSLAAFDELVVGEVWMPWTENPNDPVATALRNRMKLALEAVADARLGIDKETPALAAAQALLDNNLFAIKNQSAMDRLWGGFKGNPTRRYLSIEDDPLTSPKLPGVAVHVLGPATDEATIRDLEPPKKETFAHVGGAKAPAMPFDADLALSFERVKTDKAFAHLRVSGQVVGAIRALAADELFAAAASITSSINGTSLMLVFEIGGLALFFPGDAQWGTWRRVLKTPATRELVARCHFYKVGHHGSHNASPKSFVRKVMSSGSTAAVSVADVTVWPNIPQPDLVTAIRERATTVVQSDQLAEAAAGPGSTEVEVHGDESVDFHFEVPQPV